MKKLCQVPGCNIPHRAHGLCSRHYNEMYRTNSDAHREGNRRYYRTAIGRFKRSVNRAKSCELDWDIPLKEYALLLKKRCYLCNGKLNETGSGLDRLDNSLGYLLTNVKPCCWKCNSMKSDLSSIDFIKHIRKIIKNR